MKGAISLFGDAVQQLEDRRNGIGIEKGLKLTKCYSCGGVFWEKDWATPPSCPHCKRSRVD